MGPTTTTVSARRPLSTALGSQINRLLEDAENARTADDSEGAWQKLSDAHVLSQRWMRQHLRVHWAMLTLGWSERDRSEVLGQLFRLIVAGPGSALGRYPTGNTGRSDVSAFQPMPIRDDLAELLNHTDSRNASSDGVLDAGEVRTLYNQVAPIYDIAAAPYGPLGGRRLAQRAIAELRLEPGDTVIDLGTGTGWNLPLLSEAVGTNGHVIGVDISTGMLNRARHRLDRHDITNVDLVEHDIATYQPPIAPNAVVSTFAIEMLPDYHDVINHYINTLAPNGRIATTGLRHPERWPEWVITLGTMFMRIFGVSAAYRQHRPWETIHAHTEDTTYEERFAGVNYLAAGTTPSRKLPPTPIGPHAAESQYTPPRMAQSEPSV